MSVEGKGGELTLDRRQALLDRLCSLGECKFKQDWLDCQAVGIGPELIPELISIALDDKLHDAPGDSPLIWAPVHAWRALAGLRAAEAVEPLTTLLSRIYDDDDDWVNEEMPLVFGMIGLPAIPVLTRYLKDPENDDYSRAACARGLERIAANFPSGRDEVVAVLSAQLKPFAENGPTVNAFLISYLLDLKAVEAAPMMERAFAADYVDLMVAGDWEDIQVELGLIPARRTRPEWPGWFTKYPRKPVRLAPMIEPESSPPPDENKPLSRQVRRKAEREAAKKK